MGVAVRERARRRRGRPGGRLHGHRSAARPTRVLRQACHLRPGRPGWGDGPLVRVRDGELRAGIEVVLFKAGTVAGADSAREDFRVESEARRAARSMKFPIFFNFLFSN